jgi:NTE family protein
VRVANAIDRQVRALRKRMLIDGYQAGLRSGAYWGIRSDAANYSAPAKLDCPVDATTALANVATRMAPLPPRVVDRLINWGYAVADAAIRSHYLPNAEPPKAFPYPNAPLAS